MLQSKQKLKYLSVIQLIYTQLSEQGSFYRDGQNESKKCYATIKTDENLNISAESKPICTQLSEQDLFFLAGQNECYATIKTDKNLNISVEIGLKDKLLLVLGNITPCRPLSIIITQKLIYTCRWLGS